MHDNVYNYIYAISLGLWLKWMGGQVTQSVDKNYSILKHEELYLAESGANVCTIMLFSVHLKIHLFLLKTLWIYIVIHRSELFSVDRHTGIETHQTLR